MHEQTVNDIAIQEDVKNLRTKVEFLKSTINLLVSIREECIIIENYVKDIKKEIKLLKAEEEKRRKKVNCLKMILQMKQIMKVTESRAIRLLKIM